MPRLFVLQTLACSSGHLSVEQVHAQRPPWLHMLDRATVYRTLNLLVEHRITHAVPTPGAQAYGLARDPHPHQVCLRCHQVQDREPGLTAPRPAGAPLAFTAGGGFCADASGLEQYGTCAACRGSTAS